MRIFLVLLVVCMAGTYIATGQGTLPPPAMGPVQAPQTAGGLLGFSAVGAEGGQLITLVDASQRVMSVYHVDSHSGQITLRSVRRLTFDFAIEEFNANPPLPVDIRQMLGHRPSGP